MFSLMIDKQYRGELYLPYKILLLLGIPVNTRTHWHLSAYVNL